MQVIVNNKLTPTMAVNIAELAEQLMLPDKGVTLSVNHRIVPCAEWVNTVLMPNDDITVSECLYC